MARRTASVTSTSVKERISKEEGRCAIPPQAFYLDSSTVMTVRPLYCPQALQARWGIQNSPQLGHFTMPGAVSFQVEERLLSRLCLDTFPFGTAMLTPPVDGCFEQL